jgi:tetratricopeptide (TPR) repeat protein
VLWSCACTRDCCPTDVSDLVLCPDVPLRALVIALQRGNRHFQAQEYQQAAAAYTRALGLGIPDASLSAVLLCNRAASQHAAGQYLEAIADCCAAHKLDAKYPRALQVGMPGCGVRENRAGAGRGFVHDGSLLELLTRCPAHRLVAGIAACVPLQMADAVMHLHLPQPPCMAHAKVWRHSKTHSGT